MWLLWSRKCERRDVKGLYAKARSGEIKNFTGIDDPYEVPARAELRIETRDKTPEECTGEIIDYLSQKNFIPVN